MALPERQEVALTSTPCRLRARPRARRRWRALFVFAIFGALAGGFAPEPQAGKGRFEKQRVRKGLTDAHDPRLNAYSYVNDRKEFGRLTLVASTYLARFRLDDLYLPVGFSLLNEGKGGMHVSRDRFALLLPDGRRIPAASWEEVMDSPYRDRLNYDVAERGHADITGGYFEVGNRFVPSQLYAPPGGGTRFREEVDLYGDNLCVDWLYFRNPGGLGGQVLTLVYEDPEATAPVRKIDVRFLLEPPREPKK